MSLSFRATLFFGFLVTALGCFYLLSRSQTADTEFLMRMASLQTQLGRLAYQAENLDNTRPSTLHAMGSLRDKLETALRVQRPDLLEPVWKNLRDDIDMLLAETPIEHTLAGNITTLKIAMEQAHELSGQLENSSTDPRLEKRAVQHQLLIAQMGLALARLPKDGSALKLEANLVDLGRSIYQLLNDDPLENIEAVTNRIPRDQLEDLSALLREHGPLFRQVIQQAGTFASIREIHRAINHGILLLREQLANTVRQRQQQMRRRAVSITLALSLLGITLLALALVIIELARIARVQANRATRLQQYRRQSRAAIGEITEAIRALVEAADHPMALRHDRYGDIVEAINELLEARGKRYTTVSAQTRELNTMASAAREAIKKLLMLGKTQRKMQQNTREELHQASQTLRQAAAEARSFGESLGRVRSAVDAEWQALMADSNALKQGMKGFAQTHTALARWEAPLHRLYQLLREMEELAEACNILAINSALLSTSEGAQRNEPDIEHIQNYVAQINRGSGQAIAELGQLEEHGLSAQEITVESRERMAAHSQQKEQRMDTLQSLSSRMRSLANQSADLLRAAEAADQSMVSNAPLTEALEETAILEISDWIANVTELADALQTGLRELHTLPNGIAAKQNGTDKHGGGPHPL